MEPFARFADFYDGLYQDKDYARECDVIEALWRRHGPTPASVLDLGCGTGGHALLLARRGYAVVGVDRSPAMLAAARAKAQAAGTSLELVQQSLQELSLGRTFDAAVSMFAVLGYLTDSRVLLEAFRRIHRHLAPGGLFIFDIWFGFGVLNDPPGVREKAFEHQGRTLVRVAQPEVDTLRQQVTVRYTVRGAGEGVPADEETHPMRYFFPRELEVLALAAGFDFLDIHPMLEPGTAPGPATWNVTCVLRKA